MLVKHLTVGWKTEKRSIHPDLSTFINTMATRGLFPIDANICSFGELSNRTDAVVPLGTMIFD